METFIETLEKHHACVESMRWVIANNYTTIEQAWHNCERGDWLLWLYARLCPDDFRGLTLAKGHCAATVLHLMKDQLSKDAVNAAIDFGEGKIGEGELYAIASNAFCSAAVAYAVRAAYYAVAYNEMDAVCASYAAIAAEVAGGGDAAKKENQKQTADICRKYLTIPKI